MPGSQHPASKGDTGPDAWVPVSQPLDLGGVEWSSQVKCPLMSKNECWGGLRGTLHPNSNKGG